MTGKHQTDWAAMERFASDIFTAKAQACEEYKVKGYAYSDALKKARADALEAIRVAAVANERRTAEKTVRVMGKDLGQGVA